MLNTPSFFVKDLVWKATAMNEYEEILYDDFPYEDAHIARLATIAHLFELSPSPIDQCRVLELGCGLGGNLIPMAELFPQSQFIGIDLSGPQIERGQRTIQSLDLRNIELCAMNILDIPDGLGPFDYIVCHGVYSWVPPEVQQKILSIARQKLTQNGIAYISFNTLPGWHLRGMLREVLLRETQFAENKQEKIQRGRDLLALLSYSGSDPKGGGAWLKNELALLDQMSDSYILYEHLARHNRPMYFKDFAAEAARFGLQYLGDAHFYSMVPERFGNQAAQAIQSMSKTILDIEHYMDLLEIRYFRRTLLCHREQRINRSISFERLKGLWVSTPLKPNSADPDIQSDAVETFDASDYLELSTSLPLLKAALVVLSHHYPSYIQFEHLCGMAKALLADPNGDASDEERLARNLLGLFSRNQIQLSVYPPPCIPRAGMHPQTSALARLQASWKMPGCTNLKHRNIGVDSFERALLSRMDGTHTLEDLVGFVLQDIEAGLVSVELNGAPCSDSSVIAEVAHKKLARLGQLGFLFG